MASGALTWEDLSGRDVPFRLLLTLARHHDTSPEDALEPDTLCAHVWPDDRVITEASHNRLHVNLSTLRGMGVGDLIESHDGGYRLQPSVDILWV